MKFNRTEDEKGNPVVDIYHDEYVGSTLKRRIACRGILIDGDKILLSHEVNKGVFTLPGGGLEQGETLSQCCERELLEETGYIVKVIRHIIEIREYDIDTVHESHHFFCEIVNRGERKLTDSEADTNLTPEWTDINKSLEIFKEKSGKLGMYLREYTAICEYLKV